MYKHIMYNKSYNQLQIIRQNTQNINIINIFSKLGHVFFQFKILILILYESFYFLFFLEK